MGLSQLFMSKDEIDESLEAVSTKNQAAPDSTTKEEKKLSESAAQAKDEGHGHTEVDDVMRMMMDDLGLSMGVMKQSSLFSGDEERFAFARALSRLSEMGSQEWIERG